MRFVPKKTFFMKLIIILFLTIFMFNTVVTNYSYGLDIGGILLKPVSAIIAAFLSAVNSLVTLILEGSDAYEKVAGQNGDWYSYLASPEYIFTGKYTILDANIFKSDENDSSMITDVKKSVAGIYYMILGMCSVILLCLLIYTGIRIVLSSNSPQEQGKWKLYLMDWIKAVGLLMFIHIIMIFIFDIVDIIRDALYKNLGGTSIASICAKRAFESWDFIKELTALLMYIYISYMTIVFIISYFKRLIWTIILIIFAPIVAVLYSLSGKIYDGKGVFHRWLKEFVINAALPSFHVLVYTILIQIPLEASLLADSMDIFTLLYCIISITMMRAAEKFIRKLLGIEGQVASQGSFESGNKTLSTGVKLGIATASAFMTGGTAAGLGAAVQEINPTMGKAIKFMMPNMSNNVSEDMEATAPNDNSSER